MIDVTAADIIAILDRIPAFLSGVIFARMVLRWRKPQEDDNRIW